MGIAANEDDKNEKVIRLLLKLPANHHCINCSALGPQYVCTSFWTFVCATCAGIHREFSHRVKSVSVAKFTSEEVLALQEGGNERAKQVYFKEWDPKRHRNPDTSNIGTLRDFIKQVYVDRRYNGEKSVDRSPKVKMATQVSFPGLIRDDREDSFTHRSGDRSPLCKDTIERHYIERSWSSGRGDEGKFENNYSERTPKYFHESPNIGFRKKNSAHYFEVVDDRGPDHRSGNSVSQGNGLSEGKKLDGKSTNHKKHLDTSRRPAVRSLRDILDKIPSLRVRESPRVDENRAIDGSAGMQRTASISMRSIKGDPMELRRTKSVGHKRENLGTTTSINDPAPTQQAAQMSTSTGQSITKPISSKTDNNWVNVDCPSQGNLLKDTSIMESVDSVNTPSSVPAKVLAISVGNTSMVSVNGGVISAYITNVATSPSGFSSGEPVSNLPASPLADNHSSPKAAPLDTETSLPSARNSFNKANSSELGRGMSQPQHSKVFDITSQSSAIVSLNSPISQSCQFDLKQSNEIGSAVVTQSLFPEQSSRGRKEIPADLFTATYSSNCLSFPGRQLTQPHVTGYALQYPSPMNAPASYQSAKQRNPLDQTIATYLEQSSEFSSMASWQGAQLTESASTALPRSTSLGSSSQQWMPLRSSPYAATPSQMPPGAHMGQQILSKLTTTGHQGIGAFGNNGDSFGALDTSHQLNDRLSARMAQRSLSSLGGNPFA